MREDRQCECESKAAALTQVQQILGGMNLQIARAQAMETERDQQTARAEKAGARAEIAEEYRDGMWVPFEEARRNAALARQKKLAQLEVEYQLKRAKLIG